MSFVSRDNLRLLDERMYIEQAARLEKSRTSRASPWVQVKYDGLAMLVEMIKAAKSSRGKRKANPSGIPRAEFSQ